MIKACFYPANFDGPGCYRVLYPGDMLHTLGGHKTVIGTYHVSPESTYDYLVMSYDFNSVPVCPLYVLQMPLHKYWIDFVLHVQKMGARVVVELDDDYFNLPDYNPAKKGTAYNPWNKLAPSVVNLAWCVRHADAVTVTTPALRDTVQKRTEAPVYVLRNFSNKNLWRTPVYENRTWDKLRVGYLGLSTWHSGDIQEISWLGEWCGDNDVEFVGQGDSFDILGIPDHLRVVMPQFAFRHQKLYEFLSVMDVGLVPLARNQFNEAKSHLKGLEYAGAGIPCVATPTESYRDWWLAGPDGGELGAGFLADGPDEWVYALDRLSDDDALRDRMGRRARLLAGEHSIQNHWRLWENCYNEVLGIETLDPVQVDTRPPLHYIDAK